jgi:hypothetical protein
MNAELNKTSLDTLCAALCHAAGVTPPEHAAAANEDLVRFVDEAFGGQKCDRIFMYNPDAIGQWIDEKYPTFLQEVKNRTQLQLPLRTVMPSVTPVCFGTMYTGAQPAVHGIQKYEKPVIRIDTIFDAFIRAGKKCAIIAHGSCSMGKIFLEREMDYYILANIEEVNACATRLIMEDQYDFIACYNGNYDTIMHYNGPESTAALGELRMNSHAFSVLNELIKTCWAGHRTLMGFAMDHGCHPCDFISEKNGKHYLGTHGKDLPEDLNICHYYAAIGKEET